MSLRSLSTIAALLAAISPAAVMAQSHVAVTGFLDVGVYRGFDKARQVGTIQRSNIAFSGQETLGGGLAATFKLSHRLDLDTGTGEGAGSKPFWHGESSVGLNGRFGHLRLGRALDVISANDWAFDPWGNFDRIASPAWNNWHWNYASDRTSNAGSAEYGRLNNGLFYDSPAFGGTRLHLSGAFEKPTTSDGGDAHNTGVALTHASGAFSGMVGYSRNRHRDDVQFVGARYTWGALQVMGAFDRSTFNAAVDSVAKVITLGAVYNLGASNIKAGWATRDVDGSDSHFYGLGIDRALSKRTTVYASLGHQRPKDAPSASAYGVGVGHSF